MMVWWLALALINTALITTAVLLRQLPQARKKLKRFAIACGTLLALSVCIGVYFGVRAGLTVAGGDAVAPSQKARLLAEAISEAMNWTAFGLFGFLLPTAAAVVLFLAARKRSR